MKRLFLASILLIPMLAGCTFSRSGSQALTFNPFDLWSDEPALSVADSPNYVNGERWNQR
jgi:hypothetical protein